MRHKPVRKDESLEEWHGNVNDVDQVENDVGCQETGEQRSVLASRTFVERGGYGAADGEGGGVGKRW